MSNLYNRIDALCKARNISITVMCKDAGVSRGSLSDLKMGRNQSLSADTLARIATFFGVSIDHLLGAVTDIVSTDQVKSTISDEDLMFALWGDTENVDAEDLEDVRRYAAFVRERKMKK